MNGLPVIVSKHLPLLPDHREDARRIVRHGLRRWVEYIGEEVGPAPDEPTQHAIVTDSMVIVSAEAYAQLGFFRQRALLGVDLGSGAANGR